MKMNRRDFSKALLSAAALAPSSSLAFANEKLNLVLTTSPPDPACHFYYYAKEKGFYREAGLDVEIKSVSSPANVVRALLAGEADVVWVDGASSLTAKDAGAKLKCIASFTPQVDFSIISSEAVTSISQLPGKRFAIAAIGGSTYLLPKMMLERVGGDAKAVQWLSLGSASARAQALLAGTVDATIVATTFVPKMLAANKGIRVLGTVSEALPDMIYAWNVTTEDVLQKKKSSLQNFVRATSAAVKWAEANVDDAVAISQKVVPTADKNELSAAIRSYVSRHYWTPEGVVSAQKFNFTVASLKAAGLLKNDIKFEDFVSNEFTRKA